jgi:signal transduction histidine kinase
MKNIVRNCKKLCRKGGPCRYDLEIDPSIPETILLDTLRMTQILNNLLSNAVKFTEIGDSPLSPAKMTAECLMLMCETAVSGYLKKKWI